MYNVIIELLDPTWYDLTAQYYYISVRIDNVGYTVSSKSMAKVCRIDYDEYVMLIKRHNAVFISGWNDYVFVKKKDAYKFKQKIIEPSLVMNKLYNHR